jgi:antitoxin MazE
MRRALRKLGNASAAIIPMSMLAAIGVGIGDTIDITLEKGRIVMAPVKRRPRDGWAEASRETAEAGDDAPLWPESGNAEDEGLVW